MQTAAEVAILPRFQALQDGDVEKKSPGEVVTKADREAESLITPALRRLRPDAIVVGEEAAALSPMLVDAVLDAEAVWLVDPLDGTSNFVAGIHQFAVMVALVEKGVTTHAWIWRPIDSEAWVAQRGTGTTFNGQRIEVPRNAKPPGSLRGSVRTRFLDDKHRAFAEAAAPALGEILPGSGCAGFEYPEVASGIQDFVLFRRTLPWDHAPGALILQEAGGIVRRWDGSEYTPGVVHEGLIAAVDENTWTVVEAALLEDRHRIS